MASKTVWSLRKVYGVFGDLRRREEKAPADIRCIAALSAKLRFVIPKRRCEHQ